MVIDPPSGPSAPHARDVHQRRVDLERVVNGALPARCHPRKSHGEMACFLFRMSFFGWNG